MKRIALPPEAGVFGAFFVMVLIFSVLSENFFTLTNASVLLLNGSIIALIALGQAFVLLTGGIDLSTGANVAMTGILAASFMSSGLPWWMAAIGAALCGALLGAINGLIVHYVGIPPFIVTFAAMGVASSIPMIITRAESIQITQEEFAWIGQGHILNIPVPVILVAIAALGSSILLKNTILGTHIYAMGGNKLAARLSGISVAKTTVFVFAFSGLMAGIAGVVAVSRLNVGYPQTGTGNQLFYSIAAAVVGGVSLFGGIGTVRGAIAGVLLIATISNGMNVINVSSYWQPLVIGLIILGGVSFDSKRSGRVTKSSTARRSIKGFFDINKRSSRKSVL
jgi:ribose transport system permease protein